MNILLFSDNAVTVDFTSVPMLMMDSISILILLGLFSCTGTFRRRGRRSDKLFLAMLISCLFMAAADIIIDICSLKNPTALRPVIIFFNSAATMAIYVICTLAILYLLHLRYPGAAIAKKWYIISSIPAAVMAVLVIINPFFGLLYVYNDQAQYMYADFYFLIVGVMFVYAAGACVILWQFDKIAIIPLLILMIAYYYLQNLFFDLSTTILFLSVILIYLLIGDMNRSFHKEV